MNNLICNRFLLSLILTFSSISMFSQLLYYPIFYTLKLDGSPKSGKYRYKFFEPFYAPLQNSFISAPHLIDQSSYELIFKMNFSYQLDPQKWNLPHEIQGHSKLHAGEQNLSIDLTGNSTGVYFLQLYNETKSTVKKIILK